MLLSVTNSYTLTVPKLLGAFPNVVSAKLKLKVPSAKFLFLLKDTKFRFSHHRDNLYILLLKLLCINPFYLTNNLILRGNYMMSHHQYLAIVTVLLGVLLSACSANTIYRSDLSFCVSESANRCEKHAISNHHSNSDQEFHLGFIEYNDQGQLRKRDQMEVVLEEYYKIAIREDVIVTVFVHGWHHSAAPGDSNVESFKRLLAQISHTETFASQQEKRAKRKILGVYIGWRGDSLEIPLLNHLTFWERKNTAQEIGLQGVTEVLLKLEEIVNVKAGFETSEPKPLKSRMVVIGHSFGGAVAYTALQQMLTDRFISSKPGKTFQGIAKGFGNLVILINPAFEALRFSTLFDMSQDGCRRYFENQVPHLVVLTSEADYASRFLFSAGRSLSTLFETHEDLNRHICTKYGKSGETKLTIKESNADRAAIGHFEPYWTHKLSPLSRKNLRQDNFDWRSLKTLWSKQDFGSQLDFSDTQLTHLGRTTPLNPYLNIYVDGSLIKDHNDIWGISIRNFISDMIVISTTLITE